MSVWKHTEGIKDGKFQQKKISSDRNKCAHKVKILSDGNKCH